MLAKLGDFADAFEQGRWHYQRFFKNAGQSHGQLWADATFSSGQPAYDARIGVATAFTPCVASKNDAIFFPDIPAGMERRLTSASFRHSQAAYAGPASIVLFDLVGYYPLVDGDSTDAQIMDNTLFVPRYASGKELMLVCVNHVAPAQQDGVAVINYVDSDGVAQSVTTRIRNNGTNLVSSASNSTTSTAVGSLGVALKTKGIRSITDITYTTAPGGLHCFYLIRPLATIVQGDNNLTTEKDFLSQNGLHAPKILDGAWLGWFDMISTGAATTSSWFGGLTFAWG